MNVVIMKLLSLNERSIGGIVPLQNQTLSEKLGVLLLRVNARLSLGANLSFYEPARFHFTRV